VARDEAEAAAVSDVNHCVIEGQHVQHAAINDHEFIVIAHQIISCARHSHTAVKQPLFEPAQTAFTIATGISDQRLNCHPARHCRPERRYIVTDLGASFGRTGGPGTRSRSNLQDYVRSEFIEKVRPAEVDFVLHSRPFFLLAIHVPYYCERSRMEQIVKHIPRSDARWTGKLLARLSDQQLSDAFRAAGYSQQEVELYARQLRFRITQLAKL
jgi:hypothetical protein